MSKNKNLSLYNFTNYMEYFSLEALPRWRYLNARFGKSVSTTKPHGMFVYSILHSYFGGKGDESTFYVGHGIQSSKAQKISNMAINIVTHDNFSYHRQL